MSVTDIKREIQDLEPDQRAEIAIFVEELIAPDDLRLHPDWKQELRDRARQIEEGEVEMLDWDEVKSEFQSDFG